MNHDALMENYPGAYQSLLQIVHNTGVRVSNCIEFHKGNK